MFRRIKKLWQKKPFKQGDKVQCPLCRTVFTLVKFQEQCPQGYLATVDVKIEEDNQWH